MALAPAVQGARYTAQQITWTDTNGTAKNLTGATITARLRDEYGNERAADGTFALVTAASGIFSWTYGAGDVGIPGWYTVQFKADYGTNYDLSLPQQWRVYEAL